MLTSEMLKFWNLGGSSFGLREAKFLEALRLQFWNLGGSGSGIQEA